MDGNGRWGLTKGLSRLDGHTKGAEVARDIMLECIESKVAYATFYTLSLQNWKRDRKEIEHIFRLATDFFESCREVFLEKNARFQFVGNLHHLPEGTQQRVLALQEETKAATGTVISTCVSYGGREEILDVFRSIQEPLSTHTVSSISALFPLPDVDLVIRTSGEYRISNFLLWQSAHAEYYFTTTLWPDFTAQELQKALAEYNGRNRRFGAAGALVEKTSESFQYNVDYVKELFLEYAKESSNISELYNGLVEQGHSLSVIGKVQDPARGNIANYSKASEGATRLMLLIDDAIDSLPSQHQLRFLTALSTDFTLETIDLLLGKTDMNARFYNDTTPEERTLFEQMYTCDFLQRTANDPHTKHVYRVLAFYYFIKIWLKDILHPDEIFPYCIIVSFIDDCLDEGDDEPNLHYITEDTKRIIAGVLQDSDYCKRLQFLGTSFLLRRSDSTIPVLGSIGECFKYISEGY
jgi:undecaprenyl diphosphate synthase